MKAVSSAQLLCAALLLAIMPAVTPALGAEPGLFEFLPGDVPAQRGVEAAWRVGIDRDLLLGAAGRLELEMPDGLTFEALRTGFERRGPESVTWQGRLADHRSSRAIFTLERGHIAGWVSSPHGEYRLRGIAGGGYALSRVDLAAEPGCDARDPAERALFDEDSIELSPPPIAVADSPDQIDLLVLFTAEARDEAGGRGPLAARLRIAHSGLHSVPESGVMGDDLDLLTANNRVKDLRNAHAADLVALIYSTDADNCGTAWLMRFQFGDFSPLAYSITAWTCATTLAHEIGHNLGLHHDPTNASEPRLFPWALGHFRTNTWRTVMAYTSPCGACPRILHYSNPAVSFESFPTGIAGERDNARVGNLTAPTVANFRRSGIVQEDDFETGTIDWALNRGQLGLTSPGLEGGFALEVPITGLPGRRFLMHRVGTPGDGLNVEFLLDVAAVDLGTGTVDLFALIGGGQVHTRLRLHQKTNGQHRLTLETRGDLDDFIEVAQTPLRASFSERVRIEWRAASTPGGTDGFVRLVKNGGNRGALRDFANSSRTVREVRLGIPFGAAEAPAGGRILVDDYRAAAPTPAN